MSIVEILIITLLAELLEYFLQFKTTLYESLEKMYKLYSNSPFIFLASHTGYIWFLFLLVLYGKISIYLLLAILIKTFDIFVKIYLFKQVFNKKPNLEIEDMLKAKMPKWFFVGAMLYLYLVYLTFA